MVIGLILLGCGIVVVLICDWARPRLIRFRTIGESRWRIALSERELYDKLDGVMAEIVMPSKPWIIRAWRKLRPPKAIECEVR